MKANSCDLCGQTASIHLTQVCNGNVVEEHFCAEHIGHASFPTLSSFTPGKLVVNGAVCPSIRDAVTQGVLDNLRGAANFIRKHGRAPSSPEELLQGMALQGTIPEVEVYDATVKRQLEYLDSLIRFCEAHGRMPRTDDEFP